MNTRHPFRLSRKAAEQLLDGTAGFDAGHPSPPAGSDHLARVLAAAAAPGRADELAGEQMAVAAFEASHLVPVDGSRRAQMINYTTRAKLVTGKVLTISLAACATGGVALAAGTGAFSSPGAAPGGSNVVAPVTPSGGAPQSGSAPTASVSSPSSSVSWASSASSASSAAPAPASLPRGATALCRALVSDVASAGAGANGQPAVTLSQATQEQALASPALPRTLNGNPGFSSLTATAQSGTAVPDYCALLLGLPQLPQPGDLTQLPTSLVSQLLTALPTSSLSKVLTSLPSSTLSQVLTALPVSGLSKVLTELPGNVLSQVLTALPAASLSKVLTELPSSTLAQVLNALPKSALAQVLTELPKPVVSQLLSELPASEVSQLLSGLPSSVLSGVLSGLPTSLLSQLPGL